MVPGRGALPAMGRGRPRRRVTSIPDSGPSARVQVGPLQCRGSVAAGGSPMSDGVLAAIIAACATIFTSFLQIRASCAKEVVARGITPSGRKAKSRKPFVFLMLMLGGAAVG